MNTPLDDLLTGLDLDVVVPRPEPPFTFTVLVRTQGRRPGSLVEALDSIAAQAHPALETLVLVHGDEATRAEVVGGLGSARREESTLVLVEGGGRARPLNVGLDRAHGDYVCVLDDDDLVTPDWLAAFARGAAASPGAIVRAVTRCQDWTTDGSEEPRRPTGEPTTPFASTFDLLAHTSSNQTPVCSVALPRAALARFGLRFDETLPVFEDWDLLMRLAPLVGVASISDATSLYRRLDHGNADTAVDESAWHAAHAEVIDRLSARPLLLPSGDARRVAAAHFAPHGESRHETDLRRTRAELDQLTRSPRRWASAFAGRARGAIAHRFAARRP